LVDLNGIGSVGGLQLVSFLELYVVTILVSIGFKKIWNPVVFFSTKSFDFGEPGLSWFPPLSCKMIHIFTCSSAEAKRNLVRRAISDVFLSVVDK